MGTERVHGVSRTVLPGGLRVVTEFLPAVRSVALGIWVGVGSRDEDEAHAGATHYLEHLLFKGTRRRTALEISSEMDAVGGEMNAFTAKEYTCYYARVLDADLPLAVDILSDMVTSSLITPKDVDAERNVVLEEIAMNEDDPTDTVHEAFTAKLFGDTPLGRPILGTTDSINAITRDQIFEHYQARYTSEHLVVAAAGNLDHDTVVELVRQAFGPALDRAAEPAAPRLTGDSNGRAAGVGTTLISRGIEQANLVLGCEALARTDERRFALGVLNAAFGGGMSSRLFQEVREKRGLAYSVYSFSGQHADTGMWGIYVGCLPSKADEVLAICTEEITRVVEGGLTDAELTRGKGQVRGSIVLSLEDPSSRMSRLGKSELVYPRLEPVDEVLAAIDAVSHDDIRAIAAEILTRPKTLAVVGPFDDASAFRRLGFIAASCAVTPPKRGVTAHDKQRRRRRVMIKVGVLGARGRMGREVVRAVNDAPDLEVAAEVDQGDALDALTGCDVVVDFTHPGVVMENLRWCVEHDLDVVVGTSGFAEERLDEVRGWLADHPDVRVLVVPNFSIGAILMMRFADAGRAVLRLRRGDRTAPRRQGRRPVGHGAAHRVADRGGPGRGRPRRAAGRHRVGAAGRARRHRRRRARPLGAAGGPGGAPGGAVRRDRGDADDQARLAGPGLVHAGGAARRPRDRLPPGRPHRGPGGPARTGQC